MQMVQWQESISDWLQIKDTYQLFIFLFDEKITSQI